LVIILTKDAPASPAREPPPIFNYEWDTPKFRARLLISLGLISGWLRGIDPFEPDRGVWILPIDYRGEAFVSEDWGLGSDIELLRADGPAGLRLPLQQLPPEACRRALAIELRDGYLHLFLPPFSQSSFLKLLDACVNDVRAAKIGPVRFAGYIPSDEQNSWVKLGIASDPGVIEVNLPPCATWAEYRWWMDVLESVGNAAGLRSFKQPNSEEQQGTGGGNHLLFGGKSLDAHPFFERPGWVTSMLRYWQHHPSLSYLFTGQYVGPSSQAPRPDGGTAALYELEMSYRFLEELPEGDHRYLIGKTLRHLHTDASGNTHRSESSFDKLWNVSFEGGCRGLIEFRALESMPQAGWMSSVALLWQTVAAWLLENPFRQPLVEHGSALHDRYFLCSGLAWDFSKVLADLESAGLPCGASPFEDILDWRFPVMAASETGLRIRKALEGWPLLCETPIEGGSTSRFVDTSIERLEFSIPRHLADGVAIYVQGRKLPLLELADGTKGAGLRYRRTALFPSLHPGVPVQLPLFVEIQTMNGRYECWRLEASARKFWPCASKEAPPRRGVCRRLHDDLLTYDLRIAMSDGGQ
jgi:uncharacterized protein (DUF2126 family)